MDIVNFKSLVRSHTEYRSSKRRQTCPRTTKQNFVNAITKTCFVRMAVDVSFYMAKSWLNKNKNNLRISQFRQKKSLRIRN